MIKDVYKRGRGETAICICDGCGKEFTRKNSFAKETHRHFCGSPCYCKTLPEKLNQKYILTCAYCEKEFEIVRGQKDMRKKIHFCSDICDLNYSLENNLPIKDTNWHGIRRTSKEGYVRVYIRELSKEKRITMPEHQFVMEKHLGRKLIKGECIHHRNGIRDDNRIKNLELWTKSHPAGQRVEDKIEWAIEFLNQYGYSIKYLFNVQEQLIKPNPDLINKLEKLNES